MEHDANTVALQDEHISKRARTAEPQDPAPDQSNSGFLADFFSDPSRAIPIPNDEDEDEEPSGTASKPTVNSQLDLEWTQFERDVLAGPATEDQNRDIYDRATLVSEPQLVEDTLPEGFPPSAAPARGGVNGAAEPTLEPEPEEEGEAKKQREEKELIMDRILEEERAQEDADERVAALKARLAVVKAKRAATKAKVQESKNGKS